METKRRQYSEEFKKEAVEYSLTSGKVVEEVARDLGISPHNLKRWRTQYCKRGELAFPGHGREKLTSQEEENRRLKRELADTQIERDILKKALAIFTKKR
jgi:transposase